VVLSHPLLEVAYALCRLVGCTVQTMYTLHLLVGCTVMYATSFPCRHPLACCHMLFSALWPRQHRTRHTQYPSGTHTNECEWRWFQTSWLRGSSGGEALGGVSGFLRKRKDILRPGVLRLRTGCFPPRSGSTAVACYVWLALDM
jgi:hypothetical protein